MLVWFFDHDDLTSQALSIGEKAQGMVKSLCLVRSKLEEASRDEHANGRNGNRWRWCRLADQTHFLSDTTIANKNKPRK